MCSNAWPSAISLEEMICFVFKPFNMPPQEINYSENFLLPFPPLQIKEEKKELQKNRKHLTSMRVKTSKQTIKTLVNYFYS